MRHFPVLIKGVLMEIYEAVATLRKDKNIKIEEAIGNSMSRASFNRYINGKTDLYPAFPKHLTMI
jgi:hypothetical protein